MKLKRLLAVTVAILLITMLFAGCSSKSMMDVEQSAAGSADLVEDAAPEAGVVTDSVSKTETVTPENQKLIRTLYVDAETENMDDLLPKVEARIAELGGYVEAREITNSSLYDQNGKSYASLTIRIPAENVDAFVDHVADASNITSNRETTDDVTLQYVAVESRITALQTEEARLLELMAKAETMNDLLQIESRLTEVRTELEQVTSQLRVYDNLVNYGTIHLTLSEVEKYTEPEPEGFWDRVTSGMGDSWESLGDGFMSFLAVLIIALPYVLVIAAPAIVIWIVLRRKKKKANKAAEEKAEEQENKESK